MGQLMHGQYSRVTDQAWDTKRENGGVGMRRGKRGAPAVGDRSQSAPAPKAKSTCATQTDVQAAPPASPQQTQAQTQGGRRAATPTRAPSPAPAQGTRPASAGPQPRAASVSAPVRSASTAQSISSSRRGSNSYHPVLPRQAQARAQPEAQEELRVAGRAVGGLDRVGKRSVFQNPIRRPLRAGIVGGDTNFASAAAAATPRTRAGGAVFYSREEYDHLRRLAFGGRPSSAPAAAAPTPAVRGRSPAAGGAAVPPSPMSAADARTSSIGRRYSARPTDRSNLIM